MRRRLDSGHSAGLHPRARRVLGHRIRLARARIRAQSVRPVHHRDRRPRHPLHPSALPAPGRLPARHHARLAGIDHRIRQGHRAADRPDRIRRARRGRLSRGVPIAARLRLLREADHDGLERRQDRQGMGDADGPPRLPALRRAGRGLGFCGHCRHRSQRRSLRGDPPQHADRQATGRCLCRTPPTRRRTPSRRSTTTRRWTPATSSSSPPGRRRSATAWWTPPPRSWPGSSRSSGRGRTATAIPRTHSRATKCSTT